MHRRKETTINNNFYKSLEAEYDYQISMRTLVQRELRKLTAYKKYYLKCKCVNDRKYYYRVTRKTGKTRYLGTGNNADVKGIKQYMLYSKMLETLESNIKTIEYLLQNYEGADPDAIRSKLRECYRDAEVELKNQHSKSAEAWLEEMNKIKDSFKPYKPERLRHVALDGTKMRTKSEVLIADYLILHGIPFVYELPVQTELGMVVPDFTIYDEKTGKVFFWEHMGMLYDEGYYSRQFVKLEKYASVGYTPGINLIITVDDADGNFSTVTVEKAVKSFLGDVS